MLKTRPRPRTRPRAILFRKANATQTTGRSFRDTPSLGWTCLSSWLIVLTGRFIVLVRVNQIKPLLKTAKIVNSLFNYVLWLRVAAALAMSPSFSNLRFIVWAKLSTVMFGINLFSLLNRPNWISMLFILRMWVITLSIRGCLFMLQWLFHFFAISNASLFINSCPTVHYCHIIEGRDVGECRVTWWIVFIGVVVGIICFPWFIIIFSVAMAIVVCIAMILGKIVYEIGSCLIVAFYFLVRFLKTRIYM